MAGVLGAVGCLDQKPLVNKHIAVSDPIGVDASRVTPDIG